MKYLLTLLTLTASLVSAVLFSPDTYAAPPTAPENKVWQQTFSDEFESSSLNSSNWSSCYHWYYTPLNGCTNAGYNEEQWYLPSQVGQENGHLRLTAERRLNTPGVGTGNTPRTFDYVSGMVSTGGANWMSDAKQTFRYGYIEARIRVPSGQGLWPAFWMLPADYNWPPEIDILELVGNEPNIAHMNTHWNDGSARQDMSSYTNAAPFSDDWHTFGIDWKEDSITWYIDGVARKTVTGDGVPSTPMYILLNLAVGGDWPGSPDVSTSFPAHMDVDYVRTFSLVDFQEQVEPAASVTPDPSNTTPPTALTPNTGSQTMRTASLAGLVLIIVLCAITVGVASSRSRKNT